ncbi:MAG: class I SAM-dependent methyltransferase [Acidimicrobiales bacterium]|nr:class I SAM-dependent methyltransferase [Acidimicrobiales bacterium]
MVDKSKWVEITEENPNHSSWYVERFRAMAAEGKDLAGEARLVDAMVPRSARILDAGCGPGRVGGHLHLQGHEVVGVDVDPVLIEAARQDHPGPTWVVADLAELDLPSMGIDADFDAIVAAGNVMAFLAASTRQMVLQRLGAHLAPDGRLVTGFGAGRDYEFAEFEADVEAAGLRFDSRHSTWDLRPFETGSEFIVAVLSRSTDRADS